MAKMTSKRSQLIMKLAQEMNDDNVSRCQVTESNTAGDADYFVSETEYTAPNLVTLENLDKDRLFDSDDEDPFYRSDDSDKDPDYSSSNSESSSECESETLSSNTEMAVVQDNTNAIAENDITIKRTKKRKCNRLLWKKNSAKIARNSGK